MGGSQRGLIYAGQDIYLYNNDGDEVCHFDGARRSLVMPSGASLSPDAGASMPQLTGDVTSTAAGVTTIGAAKVTAAMLENGAGLAALIAAGLGASASYIKTTNGAQTLLASDAAARVVLLVAVVTEAFVGLGTQPVFAFGETTTPNKYDDGTVLVDAALGAVKVFAGTLTATKALLVTATAASGAGTGAISVTAFVLPAAP